MHGQMEFINFVLNIVLTSVAHIKLEKFLQISVVTLTHFTVVLLVTWPLSGSEAEVDLVLIQTLLLFICKYKLVNMRTT